MTTAALLEMPTKQTTQPAAPTVERIVLTGFMGSGKTTAGALLAAQLGWRFLDLDQEIERREGRSVPQIFAESGEIRFRHLESATLAILLGQRHVVIALGGGAPEELGNRLLLEQTPRTAVVYLTAPLDVLLNRCQLQSANPGSTARPILADVEAATHRFTKRRPQYERIATHRMDTSNLAPESVVETILQVLRTHR